MNVLEKPAGSWVDSLITHLASLKLGDFGSLDLLRRRAEMMIKVNLGEGSSYRAQVLNVNASPPVLWRTSMDEDEVQDAYTQAWNEAANELGAVFTVLRDEIALRAEKAAASQKGDAVRIDAFAKLQDALRSLKVGEVVKAESIRSMALGLSKRFFNSPYAAQLAAIRFTPPPQGALGGQFKLYHPRALQNVPARA